MIRGTSQKRPISDGNHGWLKQSEVTTTVDAFSHAFQERPLDHRLMVLESYYSLAMKIEAGKENQDHGTICVVA